MSPNARTHYQQKAKLVREYRAHAEEEAMAAAFAAGLPSPIKQPVTLITYWNRRRVFPDADNILASLKSAFDGFSDAGIWTDDRVTVHLPICRRANKLDPRVEVQIFDGLPSGIENLINHVLEEDCKWHRITE